MTRRIALAGAAVAAGGFAAVLFHPDADGTAAWGIAVAINVGLISVAAALLVAVVSRR